MKSELIVAHLVRLLVLKLAYLSLCYSLIDLA